MSSPLLAPARSAPPQRPARRALRGQIERLEQELAEQRYSHWPRARPERVLEPRGSGPTLLSMGELEALRDELVSAIAAERHVLAQLTLAEEESRRLREEILLDPAAHPGARVSNADVGESGCGAVRSEPAGLLGMLMGWWRVVVSSGCP